MYSNVVLNVFSNLKNIGRISKPDGIADCYNESNTAHVEFSLRIDSGVIVDCRFRAQANPYIVAICSTITNMVKGKMCSMIFLDPYSIKKELGDETPIDIMFCIDCFKLAIQDYKEKLQIEVKKSKKDIVNNEESLTEENKDELFKEIKQDEEEISQEIVQEDISEEQEEDDFGEDFIAGLFDDEIFEEE